MGAPKQKWTAEEEAALRAGVEKYGIGKWRAIQKDSILGPCLSTRSNVDLKDKWRNISASQNGGGSRSASKPLLLTGGSGSMKMEDTSLSDGQFIDAPPLAVAEPETIEKKSLGLRYDHLIIEAITMLNEPYGSNISTIATFIEERNTVPSNFRRLLNTKLKTLTIQGRLCKDQQQNFKINNGDLPLDFQPDGLSPDMKSRKGSQLSLEEGVVQVPKTLRDHHKKIRTDTGHKKAKIDIESRQQTAEAAAKAAARAVAAAEAAAAAAEEAARIADKAEADAERAEAAADAAALAARPPKKALRTAPPTQGVIVTV